MSFRRIASLKTTGDFRSYLQELRIDLPFDDELHTGHQAPLASPFQLPDGFTTGNRFAILPMEGWDGTSDGRPTEATTRRWHHFGISGAKLIWGGEAVAVRHDGRANPNQLLINDANLAALEGLRQTLVKSHEEVCGSADDLYIGLQLTHSGRFCRPNAKDRLEPRIVYRHPVLDKKFNVDAGRALLQDADIRQLIDDFVVAAKRASQAGFRFVDIKHCHGYLGHEFLSAVDREGAFGGTLENRMRFLRAIVEGIRAEAPGLEIGVRLSAFDWLPFRAGEDGTGEPEAHDGTSYPYAFGGDGSGTGIDLREPAAFLAALQAMDIRLVCLTAGSPYYNPHIQRPALFPPSDGYQPPEDPLAGVARQIAATAALKQQFPGIAIVGSAYSYLQEYLGHVAQHVIRTGMADFIGLGRMVLSYPEMPADILAGRTLRRKSICRTFSDCTTAPRNGLVSGCYPLDDYYKKTPEAEILKEIKKQAKLEA